MIEEPAASIRWQSCAIVEITEKRPQSRASFSASRSRSLTRPVEHVDVRLTAPNGYTAMRSYSIASAPGASDVIELAVERLADGEVSRFFTTSPR